MTLRMTTTMIRSKVKYKKLSPDDGYIDAQVCSSLSIRIFQVPWGPASPS